MPREAAADGERSVVKLVFGAAEERGGGSRARRRGRTKNQSAVVPSSWQAKAQRRKRRQAHKRLTASPHHEIANSLALIP